MPCHVDGPSDTDIQRHKTACLLVYVYQKLDHHIEPSLAQNASVNKLNNYGVSADYTPELCALLDSLPEEQINAIVYDAHNRMARDLANWWEDHKAHDLERVTSDITGQVNWWLEQLQDVTIQTPTSTNDSAWTQGLRKAMDSPEFFSGLKVQLEVFRVENYQGFKLINIPIDQWPAIWLFGILPDGLPVRLAMLAMLPEATQAKLAVNTALYEKHFTKGMVDQLKGR